MAADEEVGLEPFQTWIRGLLQAKGAEIYRSKGIIAVEGARERLVFQGVHMALDWSWGQPWKKGEPRRSKCVFIGKALPADDIKAGFESCLID